MLPDTRNTAENDTSPAMDVFGIIGQGGTGRPGEGQAAPLGQGVGGVQGVQDVQGVRGAFAALLAGAVDRPALNAVGVTPGEAEAAVLPAVDAAPPPAAPPPLPPGIGSLQTEGLTPTGPRNPGVMVESRPEAPPASETLDIFKPLATDAAGPAPGVSAPGIAGEGAQALPADGVETARPAGPAPSGEAAQGLEATIKAAQNAGETARAAASASGAAAPADPSGNQSFAEDSRERSARSGPGPQPSLAADEQVRPSVTVAESRAGNPAQTPETAKAATGATAPPPTTTPISAPAAEPAPAPLGTPGLQGALPTGDAASTGAAPESTPGRTAGASPQSEILAVRIQKAVQAGQDRISLRLHPAELGRIDVQLEFAEDGRLRAAILAERGEALDLLQRDARVLERALQEAGLKTDAGSFTFDLRDQSAHDKHQSRDVDGASRNGAEGTADLDDDPGAKPGTGSHRGLIDLTV